VSAPSPHLRTWAATAVERGRAAWPGVVVSEQELMRIASTRISEAAERDGILSLDALDAVELCLAVACARGDTAALQQFRARYFENIAGRLRRMGVDDAARDDIWQTLCERLMVATGDEPPRIVRYAGAGELSGLVMVSATRVALNWLEQHRRRRSSDDRVAVLPDDRSDPELHLLKHQLRTGFKEELATALNFLEGRDRAILRLHLVERVSIDGIAAILAVHRATAARWIRHAKRALTLMMRDRLVARWRLAQGSLPDVEALLGNQVDLSLERLLGGD
jgi:RNA polymerase sigma-70 factor (ECF subfamily)